MVKENGAWTRTRDSEGTLSTRLADAEVAVQEKWGKKHHHVECACESARACKT